MVTPPTEIWPRPGAVGGTPLSQKVVFGSPTGIATELGSTLAGTDM